MKLKKYLKYLNKLAEENPEILEMTLVYSIDNEGNNFHEVSYLPSLGKFSDGEFISEEQFDEFEVDDKTPNSICIN